MFVIFDTNAKIKHFTHLFVTSHRTIFDEPSYRDSGNIKFVAINGFLNNIN